MNKSLLALAAALLLVGAGCSGSPAANSDLITGEASGEEVTSAVDAVKTEIMALATKISVDDTWRTYTSRAGDWQFQWPTKGRFAPQWEVSFAPETKDGCYGEGETRRLKASDAEFCHVAVRGGTTATDHYVTMRGGQAVLLTFTKDAPADFDWKEYAAFLDQVVSTFKVVK